MNDDVPARDAEGRTSFYAEKTAQSLYAQLGLRQLGPPGRDPSEERACEWTSGWAGVTWS